MPKAPTEPWTYVCVDPMTGALNHPGEAFETASQARGLGLAGDLHLAHQVECPVCGSRSVRPYPFEGPDAP
jgi:hypothetical protein